MSLISEESINAIREKANLVDVISDYITLKKTGRSYKGLCPFHQEKTPSFVVDSQKQLYHCFGCAEGGNVFNFAMKVENLDFSEAVEFVAQKVGLQVKYVSKGKNEHLQGQKERYLQINKEAADFYHYLLMKSEQGREAREYLKGRGYGQNVANTFKLGYASPNKCSLINSLLKKDFKQIDMSSLDLAYKSSSGEVKDRFFNRLMFPIEDARGNIVGFGGRGLTKEAVPKYLNSANTPLFNKSKQFYGLNLAKSEIVHKDQAILVEGYTDVISMHKGGFKNTVATLGTALTVEHLQILARFCASAIMLFDSDTAGVKAASRSIEFADATNLELLVAVLPEGDPADFIANKGPAETQTVLSGALPLADFCLGQIVAGADLSTPKKRLKAISESFDLIAKQKNAILEQEYLLKLAKLTGVPISNLTVEYNKKHKAAASRQKDDETVANSVFSAEERAENLLLAILIENSQFLKESRNALKAADFVNEQNAELFKILESGKSDITKIVGTIQDAALRKHLSALCFVEKPADLEQAYAEVSKKIKDFAFKRRIKDIKDVLEKTNPLNSPEEYDKLFKRLIGLEAKRRDLLENRSN